MSIMQDRRMNGVIKEFTFKCNPDLVLRVKMPNPKLLQLKTRELQKLTIQSGITKDTKTDDLTVEQINKNYEILDYYMDEFEKGLQDGDTLDLLDPEEYSELQSGITDFFGLTHKKDGTNSPTIQSGETV